MERYSSESSDSDGMGGIKTLDYSYLMLTSSLLAQNIQELSQPGCKSKEKKPEVVQTLLAYNNLLTDLPQNVSSFHSLRHINISNNRLKFLPEFLTSLPLNTLIAKNNLLTNECLPKSFKPWASSLKKLNLGGNQLHHFPMQAMEVIGLRYLYLGSNLIDELPRNINHMQGLAVLCLGGNRLTDVPEGVGKLEDLEVLVVSDNQLESLPPSIARLKKLKTLQLHKNRLRALPTEILSLKCLTELSLRDNPLVLKFVNDMTLNPASLLEISARTIKLLDIPFQPEDLPPCLRDYLCSAHRCVNPKCNGVFFDNHVEHIKFVDFCGKYRVPLLQYLCSSKCVTEDTRDHSQSPDESMMRKVLLG